MGMTYKLENPAHPGGYVLRNVIEPRNLTVMDAASLLDVPRQMLFDFVHEKTNLTPELALRIEAVFGVEMETLMAMQTEFDIAETRKRCRDIPGELAAKSRPRMPAPGVDAADTLPRTIVRRVQSVG